MQHKVKTYGDLVAEADRDVQRHLEVAHIRMQDLKVVARVRDDTDNWHIFESVSELYREAKDRSAIFEALRDRAEMRLSHAQEMEDVACLRDSLVDALRALTNFAPQSHILGTVVDLVGAFLKDPRLFRRRLLNFMLVGSAGTGKTTLAGIIGDVFAKAGMFVGDRLVEAGRAELVGQYEGQTVARTRSFLISNLDNGVIFIDEAYAITPWQAENRRDTAQRPPPPWWSS